MYRQHANSVPKISTGIQIHRFRQAFNANECTNTHSFTKSEIKMTLPVVPVWYVHMYIGDINDSQYRT
jgi:hypothetical protein